VCSNEVGNGFDNWVKNASTDVNWNKDHENDKEGSDKNDKIDDPAEKGKNNCYKNNESIINQRWADKCAVNEESDPPAPENW